MFFTDSDYRGYFEAVLGLDRSEESCIGQDFYHLETDQETSFIVRTYLAVEDKISLWYREDKKTVYLAFQVNRYVMCLHFTLEKTISHSFVEEHMDDFIYGIMEKSRLVVKLVQLVLGGMKHATHEKR